VTEPIVFVLGVIVMIPVIRLDPTGYEISPNVFRIYYASGSITDNNYTIERATLRFK